VGNPELWMLAHQPWSHTHNSHKAPHPTSLVQGAADESLSTTLPATYIITAIQAPKDSSFQVPQRERFWNSTNMGR